MPIYPIGPHFHQIDPDTYIAPTAVVAGEVTVKKGPACGLTLLPGVTVVFPLPLASIPISKTM